MQELKYIVSQVTTFNEDHQLFETKIGTNGKGMPLYYLAFGKSQETSRERAQNLADLLNSVANTTHH